MIDTDGGRPPARSEDKYKRVCWKLIHHHAYSTRPLLTLSKHLFNLLSLFISLGFKSRFYLIIIKSNG
jgi:hypothetical protein